MDLETTIVAVSSPSGRSLKSLIRVSGVNALTSVLNLGLEPIELKMVSGKLEIENSKLPVLVSFFPSDNSYTGQDVIEILLPNNRCLINKVIDILMVESEGRLAEAGEFTARAFFNGNITLTSAEGVCATVSANNESELRGAALLRKGCLATAVEPISTKIVNTLSLVESGIDFIDEEEVVSISKEDLEKTVSKCIHDINSILDSKISMETLHELPIVVLAGFPNAGKSALFNALVSKQRVVVSSKAGTTRDSVSEYVLFDTKESLLFDVAGFESQTDDLSASMQLSAMNTVQNADLILWCVSPTCKLPEERSNTIVVHTKGDLKISHSSAVSAFSGEGLDELRSLVASKLSASPIPKLEALALLSRHELCLRDTIDSLQEVLDNSSTLDIAANSLRNALNSIGAVTGRVTPDEIIGEVFSRFCIGK
ncbi:MAG: 50S ribosome-binding GTPase [Phycisphaerales bacterium]|jgi:tRNA modification GTPase|nr:50S ribosome-binding GTPase [Phycisphaerales bacterium]